jgi:hypothetical protein
LTRKNAIPRFSFRRVRLAQLTAAERRARNIHGLRKLSIPDILRWADSHHARSGGRCSGSYVANRPPGPGATDDEWCVRNIEDLAPQIDELVPDLAPGDPELECATRAVATGIEVSDAGLESIKIAAELVGVAVFGIARTTIHAEQPHGLENCLDRSRPSYGTEV